MAHRRTLLLIITILFPFALYASPQAATNAPQSTPVQSQPTQTPARPLKPGEVIFGPNGDITRISKHSGSPAIGDFKADPTAPESVDDQQRRQKREASFFGPDPDHVYNQLYPEIKDPGKYVYGFNESSAMKVVDYIGGGSRLPAHSAAAVIIGTVLSGQAFVFHDHSYVYSDYSIRIDEILKPDANTDLFVGGQLVAFRLGGTIRFPSGHIKNFFVLGEGYPKVGSQYLFFLGRPDVNIREYSMTLYATYELSNGKVFPLDDGMDDYDGISQNVLLDQVKKLIAASKDGDLQ
jgi:hypothetical protein